MLRTLFLGLLVSAGCASAPRRPPEAPSVTSCLRLDERAGVPPSARRACWAEVARTDPTYADHATLRARALAAETTEPVVSDAPARLRLDPTPPATLPPPPPAPPAPPDTACVERGRACDAECTGSAAWAECIGRCDGELARCMGR